jgi:hypothetical protein
MRNQLNFNASISLPRIVTHHGREKTVLFRRIMGRVNMLNNERHYQQLQT